jgi:phenylalanyl-tRNA synthetase alpha subunit
MQLCFGRLSHLNRPYQMLAVRASACIRYPAALPSGTIIGKMIDQKLADALRQRVREGDRTVLRSPELKALFDELKTKPAAERAAFGQAINELRAELQQLLDQQQNQAEALPPIDVTAPFDINTPAEQRPRLLPAEQGSQHPLND